MGFYAIRHHEDGLAGAMLLHRTPMSKLWVFDYPTTIGNPSVNDLLRFETEGDCEAWLLANLDTPTWGGKVGDGYTVWIE